MVFLPEASNSFIHSRGSGLDLSCTAFTNLENSKLIALRQVYLDAPVLLITKVVDIRKYRFVEPLAVQALSGLELSTSSELSKFRRKHKKDFLDSEQASRNDRQRSTGSICHIERDREQRLVDHSDRSFSAASDS